MFITKQESLPTTSSFAVRTDIDGTREFFHLNHPIRGQMDPPILGPPQMQAMLVHIDIFITRHRVLDHQLKRLKKQISNELHLIPIRRAQRRRDRHMVPAAAPRCDYLQDRRSIGEQPGATLLILSTTGKEKYHEMLEVFLHARTIGVVFQESTSWVKNTN